MKYGMAKRVFEYISRFHFTEQQWCEPKAVLEAVLIEFDLLCGRHEKKYQIYGFSFVDEQERQFLARMITRSFFAHGVSDGRSDDLVQKKAVLLPRAR
jgi:hypothetical protein